MRPASREMMLALLLALAGTLAWWLQRTSTPEPPPPPPRPHLPDYIVEQLDAVTMSADGEPERRLVADRLRHYPDDGSSELDRPRLWVYREDGPPWQASAATGWLNADGDELLLEQDVRLERSATDAAPPLLLRTSEMLVLPEADYAETARFAEIDRGDDWVTARDGLRVWLGDSVRARLFGRARARYGVADSTRPNTASDPR